MKLILPFALLPILLAGCATMDGRASAAAAVAARQTPAVDHHKHLMGPGITELANGLVPEPEIDLPHDLAALVDERMAGWNDPERLARIFVEDATFLVEERRGWIHGRAEVVARLARRFGSPYRILPSYFRRSATHAEISGYYVRGEAPSLRYLGHVLLTARREEGRWKLVSEIPRIPYPEVRKGTTADELVAVMDRAGVRRAVVLSEGFWADGPLLVASDPFERMVAENDWTAREAARFPDRLVAFCSFNPVADHALNALERCASQRAFRGIKFSFAMSAVNLRNPEHLRRVTQVFAAANQHRLPVVVHLRGGNEYGREHVGLFLDHVMAAAPDIVVQIAHLWGGEAYAEEALAALADAMAARRPGTQNLYFDMSEATLNQPSEVLNVLAERIRQIGPRRVLFGSDAMDPALAWRAFRGGVPLTDAEFTIIARNVAPYLR
jgi:predicted TIM-barrel fold metal-dependent hydrolase